MIFENMDGHPDLAIKYCVVYTVTPMCGVKGDGCDRVDKIELEIFSENATGERIKFSEMFGYDACQFKVLLEKAKEIIDAKMKEIGNV